MDNVIRRHQSELDALMNDDSDLRVRLVKLLRLSEEMVRSAMAGDWDQVDAMEKLRRRDLDECFSQGFDLDRAPVLVEAVAALLHLNEKLVDLVAAARSAAATASREAQAGQRAVDAYLRVQPGGG